MPTYFGYVEREADNYINWADVSKDITGTINDIQRVRDEKKQALDDDYRAELKNLALQPKGQDEAANKYMTEYGDNASNFLMMQNKLLKQGRIQLKNYVNAKQNLSDGTDNLFQIMKDYQANYTKYMDRYKNNESSSAELWSLKDVEKFADFEKSGAYISADGSVMAAMKTMKNVDGKEIYTLDTSPGQVASMSVLRDAVNTMFDRYDVNAVTTETAKAMGTYVESLYINGQIASVEDITALKYGQDPLETTETLRNAIADLNSNEKKELVLATDEKTKAVTKTAFGNETEVAQMYKDAKAKTADKMTEMDKKVVNFVETKLSGLIEKSKGPKVDFYKSETDIIRGAIGTPERYMSVLTDNKQIASNGKPYEYQSIDDVSKVEQLTKENPHIVYMAIENGKRKPVLSSEQKIEAEEYMRGIMRAKYTLKQVDKGSSNKYDLGQGNLPKSAAPSPEQQKLWATNRGIQEEGAFMANLYNGNKTEINAALNHFGLDTRLNSIERNEDGIYITYKDPTIKDAFIPFFNPDGTAFGTDNFLDAAKRALLYPESFDLIMAKQGVNNKSLMPNLEEFNTVSNGEFAPTPEREESFWKQAFPEMGAMFSGDRASKIAEKNRINQTAASGGGGLNASARKQNK
jgi:hypothetical protein